MAEIRSYRDLVVWQEAIQLAKIVYQLSAMFPREELYGLTSQIRRATVSVPSNITEGHGRAATGDYLRFLSIALGSWAEVETQLCLAVELGFCAQENIDQALNAAETLGRRLHALQRSLKTKVN